MLLLRLFRQEENRRRLLLLFVVIAAAAAVALLSRRLEAESSRLGFRWGMRKDEYRRLLLLYSLALVLVLGMRVTLRGTESPLVVAVTAPAPSTAVDGVVAATAAAAVARGGGVTGVLVLQLINGVSSAKDGPLIMEASPSSFLLLAGG